MLMTPKGRREKNCLGKFLTSLLFLAVIAPGLSVATRTDFLADGGFTPVENSVLALVNGSEAYSYDLHLENIALSHPAFRAAGSVGANEAADWIANQFEDFGLQAEKEEFQFTCWDLRSHPELMIDDDGNPNTFDDQIAIESFQCEHYSWPTPSSGVFSDLVVLPLPPAADRSRIGVNPIDIGVWNSISTTGKVILIGREVRWDPTWEVTFRNKLTTETPAVIVYTWWYDWLALVPEFFSSAGGRPNSVLGAGYYWNLQIPVGFVDYEDGLLIRTGESSLNVSAKVTIDSVLKAGSQYNVVARLTGCSVPSKFVIVSGHYDTVMSVGFCDNGAGTSGVIELANVLSKAVKDGLYSPKFTIAFVAFAGEEIGLVGSINYVIRHKAQMKDLVAVINLDCIGSDNLYVTKTDSVNGFDLDGIILNAARDLGIAATLQDPGGSDQESFRDPTWANSYYNWCWSHEAEISTAKPVKSSAMLISNPLSYSDGWNLETPGWIHTSYDNSSSTETLSWVELEDLESHIKVAALTIIRISPPLLYTDLDRDGVVSFLDLIVVRSAFGTKCGDDGWNPVADLDKNGIINILDLSMVAKDYRKAV